MKFYDTEKYLVIIYYTSFETRIRNVSKSNLESFITKLNETEDVFDYCITKVVDFDYD